MTHAWRFTLLSAGLLCAVWIAVTSRGLVSDLFLPGPALVWSGFVDLVTNGYAGRPLGIHVLDSLVRVLCGFGTVRSWGAASGSRWECIRESTPSLARTSNFCGRCRNSRTLVLPHRVVRNR